MYQLIYISEKSQHFKLSDIPRILKSAMKNNELLNVTGLLLNLPHHFIQVLEGNQLDVESIFSKISDDSRHDNIRCIYKQSIMIREFGDWSMGFSAELAEEIIQDTTHVVNEFARKQTFSNIQVNGLKFLLKSLNSAPTTS
ncbi:MAG: BLUF domain-containing protein [Paraglaciecola sp.]|uniref:BLUF domain-containing protein n=1 Tax=Paraglaciecola sp. TaxID=1920173 RepID=UPI0032644078